MNEINISRLGMARVNNRDGLYFSNHELSLLTVFAITILSASAAPNLTQRPKTHAADGGDPDTTALYNERRTFILQSVSAACAALSMVVSFIAFYWFMRMEKRFRHRLVMLLIFGDVMKATWLFVFAITSIARGNILTRSTFCQATGFLIQYGTEMSDYSVLVMALHSAIQVFRPSTRVSNDGLYAYRAWIYIGAFIVPGAMSGLAFINPHYGYMSQGAFCSLPLRPFWYRLALAWIPRYLIAMVIIGLAVAIYAHVGFEYRAVSTLSESMMSIGDRQSGSTNTPRNSAGEMEEGSGGEASGTQRTSTQHESSEGRTSSSKVQIVFPRRPSQSSSLAETTSSHPHSLLHGHHRHSLPIGSAGASILLPSNPRNSSIKSGEDLFSQPDMGDCHTSNNVPPTSPLSECPNTVVQRRMAQERARIHKQLRLIFIYPLVYTLMWLVPFINHCMNYKDQWAVHPVYWLSFLSTICITMMGFVDCLVFSLRERPWRFIDDSDGTFWGSFAIWGPLSTASFGGLRRPLRAVPRTDTEMNPHTPHRAARNRGSASSVIAGHLPHISLPMGARGDRLSRSSYQKTSAEMARARLKFEREDRKRTLARARDEESRRVSDADVSSMDAAASPIETKEDHVETEGDDEKEKTRMELEMPKLE